jgi:hypothetical protein
MVNKQTFTRGVELPATEHTARGLLQIGEGAYISPDALFVSADAQGVKGAEG